MSTEFLKLDEGLYLSVAHVVKIKTKADGSTVTLSTGEEYPLRENDTATLLSAICAKT